MYLAHILVRSSMYILILDEAQTTMKDTIYLWEGPILTTMVTNPKIPLCCSQKDPLTQNMAISTQRSIHEQKHQ